MRIPGPALVIAVVLAGSAARAQSGDSLELTFETTSLGGEYAPRNVVAVWVEDAQGTFVKTIGRWSNTRTRHLVAWIAASGQDNDAVSGATRSNHTGALSVLWDLNDKTGAAVPNGDYSIHVEICEDNTPSGNLGINAVATLPFTIDGNHRSETGLSGTNVVNATIDYLAGETAPEEDPDPPAQDDAGPTASTPSTPGPTPSRISGGCAATGTGTGLAPYLLLGLWLARRRRARSREPGQR